MSARFIAILCVVVTLPGVTLAQSNQRALIGGTLLDGSGGKPLRNSVVLIDGERITAVGDIKSIRIPDGYEKISTEGMAVLPGLWDMHVHLLYAGHTDFPYWHRTYTSQYEDDYACHGAAVADGRYYQHTGLGSSAGFDSSREETNCPRGNTGGHHLCGGTTAHPPATGLGYEIPVEHFRDR